MPNGLRNWSYRDVIGFLKEHGFAFHKQLGGSHETWVNIDTKAVVNVNRTASSYPLLTLQTMIRQSKVNKADWRAWGES